MTLNQTLAPLAVLLAFASGVLVGGMLGSGSVTTVYGDYIVEQPPTTEIWHESPPTVIMQGVEL